MPRYCSKYRLSTVSRIVGKFERYIMKNKEFRIKILREALKKDGTLDYTKLNNRFLKWFLG